MFLRFFITAVVLLALTGCAGGRNDTLTSWEDLIRKTVQKDKEKINVQISPNFTEAGVSYPPKSISLLAFKDSHTLELWAEDDNSNWKYIKTYPILADSGTLGPKLYEGDLQIPEGIYQISGFNPISQYHLSMQLNYPNDFDLQHATIDNRHQLGDNIFIHGNSVSQGCIALGNKAIEELFVLTYLVGAENTQVVISPVDFRRETYVPHNPHKLKWLPTLYAALSSELKTFRAEPQGKTQYP